MTAPRITPKLSPVLICGDCLAELKKLPDSCVDFVCCDPPFGITDAAWDKAVNWTALWKELRRICTPNAVMAIFSSGRFTYELYNSNPEQYRYKWVWRKTQGTDYLNANIKPMTCIEEILVFYQGKLRNAWYEPQKTYGHPRYTKNRKPDDYCSEHYAHKNGSRRRLRASIRNTDGSRYPVNILDFPTVAAKYRTHGSQKPVPLLEHLIKSHCKPGGVVLDFCMGSGATGVASLNTGRSFIGIEINPDFFAMARSAVYAAHKANAPEFALGAITSKKELTAG